MTLCSAIVMSWMKGIEMQQTLEILIHELSFAVIIGSSPHLASEILLWHEVYKSDARVL